MVAKKKAIKPTKERAPKSKYGARKVTYDDITFDSTMEGNYYLHLKDLKAKKAIKDFSLQPTYLLLEGFRKNGKAIRAMNYKGDFLVTYNDDTKEVIDVKGKITDVFALKRKLFDFKYPDLILKLVTFNDKTKEWVDFDELKKTKQKAKREKSAKSKAS